MGRTLEEHFLLKLHELALHKGDPETSCLATHVGDALRYSSRQVQAICNTLAQTNFIRKLGDGEIVLTPHGLKLVHELKK